MTITAQTSKTGPYNGNGTTTVFSYTFEVQDEAHLVVTLADATGVESVQVLNADYTVSGVGNANGGQITMSIAPASGYTLTISRNIPITQEVDLENRRSVAPEVLEDAYDKLTQIAQDLSEQVGRALKISVTEGGTPSTTLQGDVVPGAFVGFGPDGNFSMLTPPSGTFIASGSTFVAVDAFTGDGTTVDFTMGGIPASSGNVFVYIDGVMQDAANYTVSGTTLTFSTAPPLNSNIEMRRFQGIATNPGATTADLVTYSPAGTGAQDTTVEAKLRQYVSVKDFGAVGDGVTDDTAAIQAAIDATPFEVEFTSGTYKTTAPIIIKIGKSVQLNNAIIEAHFNNGYIFEFERDPTGRPKFYLEGKGGAIRGAGAFAYDATLNGVLVESSSFSRVGGFSISAVNRPIVIAPTGARDCINNVFYNIDTNTTNGMRINAGTVDGVTYQDTTTGQFNDIFFTCIGPNSNAIELVSNGPAGSIFGLNFNRCSFNPVHSGGGRYIYMVADPLVNAATIYNIYFNNCEGELRYTGVGTPTIPAVYMERVFNSKVQLTAYWDDANGIKLVRCSGNIFENSRDQITTYSDAKFIDIDAASFGNSFINVYPQLSLLSTDEGFSNAPLAANYFQRIEDGSNRNTFTGLMATDVKRVIKTEFLNLIDSSGDPINPIFDGFEATRTFSKNANGNYEVVSTTPSGFQFTIPFVPFNVPIVIRMKYRFLGALTGVTDWRLASSTGGTLRAPTMRVTNDWVDMMYMTKIDDRQCRVFSPVANPTVTIEIEKLEVFLGAFPYPPNYSPVDVYQDQFDEHPFGTTAKRPVSPPIMTNYFDTTLNKLITWDGTNWRDGAGTIV